MKLRQAAAVTVALSLSLFVAACGDDDDDDDAGAGAPTGEEGFPAGSTMARLSEAQSIKVGTKFDQPLFGLQSLGGDPEGFDVEIAKIIVEALGIPEDNIEWVETPSAVREEAIEQGRVDMVVATYTINEERAQRVSFAGPYYQAGQLLMVRSDNNEINGPDDLRDAGSRVCTVQGSTPEQNIRQYIDESQLVTFDVYSRCAEALSTGQVDVVTTDNVILLGFVDQYEGEFKLVGEPFTEEPYGIGVTKGDVEFCEFINETLTQAADDGSYAEAWESTAGQVAEETPELPELQPCS